MDLHRLVDQIRSKNPSEGVRYTSLLGVTLDIPPAPSMEVMEALAAQLSYSVEMRGRIPNAHVLSSMGKAGFWCMPQLPEQVRRNGGVCDYAVVLTRLRLRYATPWEFLCWALTVGPRCEPPGYFAGVTSFHYDEDSDRRSDQFWPYYNWNQRMLRFERVPVTYCDVLQLVTTL